MKKNTKSNNNLQSAQTKFEDAINKQVDKQIDKIVDETFDKIEKQEKEDKKIKKIKNVKENKNEKIVFGLSYFLFFISLIFSKSEDRKFYANQGIVLLIFAVVGSVFFRFIISLIHYETGLIMSLVFDVFVILFAVFGLVKTLMGEKFVKLPLIGNIKLIK